MKTLILITLLLTHIIVDSDHSNQITSILEGVESYINDYPTDALTILQNIDRSKISSSKQKAHFALLYSMALDKNYIDLTNDSIINNAVNYYKIHRDKDRLFKSYYYQARIYENAGDFEKAMKSITRAENINNITDFAYIGRLKFLKSGIYAELMDYDTAIIECKKAAYYSKKGNKLGNYHQSLLNIARYNMIKKNYDECYLYLDTLKQDWNKMSLQRKHLFYDIKILLSIKTHPDSTLKILADYFKLDSPENSYSWRTIAYAYEKNELYISALSICQFFKINR